MLNLDSIHFQVPNTVELCQLHRNKAMASWTGIGPAVLVTGSNRGIGLGLVKQLAKCPEVTTIFAGCRDPEKAAVRERKSNMHK